MRKDTRTVTRNAVAYLSSPAGGAWRPRRAPFDAAAAAPEARLFFFFPIYLFMRCGPAGLNIDLKGFIYRISTPLCPPVHHGPRCRARLPFFFQNHQGGGGAVDKITTHLFQFGWRSFGIFSQTQSAVAQPE